MDKKYLDFAAFLSTEHMLNGIGLKEGYRNPIIYCSIIDSLGRTSCFLRMFPSSIKDLKKCKN